MRELGAILHTNFAKYGYRIPTAEAKFCIVKLASFFRDDAKKISAMWNKELNFENTRSREVLA